MHNILILNPSTNLKLIAREMYGTNIIFANSPDIPQNKGDRVFYFLKSGNLSFTIDIDSDMEKENRVYLFKNNLFSKFRMMGFRKKMISLYPEVTYGCFKDMLLFKRKVLRASISKSHDRVVDYKTYQEAVDQNQDKIILTSMIIGEGKEILSLWETDFDLISTFGDDYFVFCNDVGRVEGYVCDNKLALISHRRAMNPIDVLSSITPIIKKFNFKQVEEKKITRNRKPWLLPMSNNTQFLINDYSFNRLSISMASSWYDKVAGFIQSQIVKK